VSAGNDSTASADVVAVLYMSSGMRLIDMPGARSRKMVTRKLMAPAVVDRVKSTSAMA
jgi:hypothetical protein